ncbi:uncharacterized protein LOC127095366, partial [Lathyrus oleraceus]|uniref:uncharacterized protein LOC127095366 n=1 Tax=Pisum sativum TaxID=3888 RepID=UPI0021D1F1D4
MEPKASGKRYKTNAQENATPPIDYFDSDISDNDIFINEDAKQRFIKNFSSKSAHSERGFIFSQEEKDLGLPDEIDRIIVSVDEYDLEVLRDSLCLEGMTWSIVQKSAKKNGDEDAIKPYKPPIPYPQRLANSKTAGQFRKFVELLKQLNITIPFTEVITQMPSYDNETVTLTAECSAIIQNNMPPKLKDPSSFSIPCVIGKFVIDKALCDLGANISVMPLTICKRLNMGELRPTKMSVQLADRSIKYPVGILENVPVRVGQFYIPTDFIIMDIKEDASTPIILGRSFLATARIIIDVKRGKLTFEVGEEKVEFILTQFLQAPAIDDT